MAKPNDMPEFHSVKVSLTENIPARQQALQPDKHSIPAKQVQEQAQEQAKANGGQHHV